jgi:hypothetical protein
MEIKNDSKSPIIEKYNNLTDDDFIILKSRYDNEYQKYWTYRNNPPKFNVISMEEFKQRLIKYPTYFFKKYGEI